MTQLLKTTCNDTALLAADGVLRMLAAREVHVSAAVTLLVFLSTGIRLGDPKIPSKINGIACELQRFIMGRATRLSVLSLLSSTDLNAAAGFQEADSLVAARTALQDFVTGVNSATGKLDWSVPVLTAGSFLAYGLSDTFSVPLRIPAVYVDVQASICHS